MTKLWGSKLKYKAEVLHHSVVQAEFYYSKLSHPNQVVRNVVTKMKGKLNYFLVFIINDSGEMWKYSVMKKPDKKLYVRKIEKSNAIFTRDDLDMIFTGNRTIVRGAV